MKALLMHRDRDVDLEAELPPDEALLTQDLELERLFEAMALGDPFILDVARRAVLSSLTEPEAIAYRQDVLRDCLDRAEVVRELYALAGEALQAERRSYFALSARSPDMLLHQSVRRLETFMEMLQRLRAISDAHAGRFRSEGFVRLFATLARELDDEYFRTVDEHLQRLRFRDGALISARLDRGNKGTGYVLRTPRRQGWRERVPWGERSSYSFQIADRDEAGAQQLAELRGRGIALVADALARSTDHLHAFFGMLRSELAFYVGCVNLHSRLAEKGEPTCLPVAVPPGRPGLSCRGLYDVGLSLSVAERVVGNEVQADGKALVMITGPNQGGKSTFLRSVGLAQLMMQSGMFVAAESFAAEVGAGVFTHFRREEDATMESGKLDEELRRMSDIVDRLCPHAMLLCNESFASTNEREGSEIARQVVRALLDAGARILFVTHMYELAHGVHSAGRGDALFLRAEREPDGRRTFRLVEGEPLPTSHGEDLYRRIFGVAPDGGGAASHDRVEGPGLR